MAIILEYSRETKSFDKVNKRSILAASREKLQKQSKAIKR